MALGKNPTDIVNDGKHKLLVKAPHWERVHLGSIAEVQNGYAFSSSNFTFNEGLPLIRIRDIAGNETENKYNGEFSDEYIVKKGDILIGMDGDFNTARWNGPEGLLNQRVCRIKSISNNYNDKFLFICLQPYLNAINAETSAVTVKHLSSRTVEEIPLPLPPLSEQLLIVSKIEELFSDLDKGIESLKTAQQQLKVYRRAVIRWAFDGKLTEEWRKNNASELDAFESLKEIKLSISGKKNVRRKREFEQLNVKDLEQLPRNWEWVRIGEVCECLDYLRKPVNKDERNKRQGNIPYYGANGQTGLIDDYLFDEPLVLVVEDETFVGRVLPYSYKIIGKSWVNNHVHILRANHFINIDFLNYQLSYYPFLGLTTGTTGRKKLTQDALVKAPIKFCTIDEQLQIVQEIESRLSVCDKIEESIENSLKQAEVLRQSILKKAFEGRLVPQDLNDEPASVLLKRIQAEKAAAPQEKKPKKTKKTTGK